VAFVVLRAGLELEENELLCFCEPRLGDFKTPTRIFFAEDLPKGPSGKVQRLRLADEAAQLYAQRTGSVARVSEIHGDNGNITLSSIEQTIADTWASLLATPRVGLHDNFFGLGGDSLLAIQCLARLRDRLPVRLTLSEFFEHGTIAQQAALVRKRLSPGERVSEDSANIPSVVSGSDHAHPGTDAIPPRERELPCRLSAGQERLWFMEQLNPDVPVYNESEAVKLFGELNVDALERALNEVIARHEMLQATIRMIDGQPIWAVQANWQLRLKKVDLSSLPAALREAEVEHLLIAEPRVLYRLQDEPGIRATLVRSGPREHVFILMMHHIVCDWSSEGVLWRELAAFYRGFCIGEPVTLPDLPIQDGDYCAWQRQQSTGTHMAEDLSFWVENLSGAPAFLDLPSDRPRPPVMSHRGVRQRSLRRHWTPCSTGIRAVRI
jgi:aryl carrier-like protein